MTTMQQRAITILFITVLGLSVAGRGTAVVRLSATGARP